MQDFFRRISTRVSNAAGKASAFLAAFLVVLVWVATGPYFNFSDTWQLVINTGTTIVTFLMVFLIQNTQNRDSKAMQLKLDELIRSSKARNSFVDLEDLTDEELKELDSEFRDIHESSRPSLVLKKLHASIELEHMRRKSSREQLSRLNPLNKLHQSDKKQK